MLAKEAFLVYIIPCDAGLAQLVARNLAKVEVAGSNPVARSMHSPGRLSQSALYLTGEVAKW